MSHAAMPPGPPPPREGHQPGMESRQPSHQNESEPGSPFESRGDQGQPSPERGWPAPSSPGQGGYAYGGVSMPSEFSPGTQLDGASQPPPSSSAYPATSSIPSYGYVSNVHDPGASMPPSHPDPYAAGAAAQREFTPGEVNDHFAGRYAPGAESPAGGWGPNTDGRDPQKGWSQAPAPHGAPPAPYQGSGAAPQYMPEAHQPPAGTPLPGSQGMWTSAVPGFAPACASGMLTETAAREIVRAGGTLPAIPLLREDGSVRGTSSFVATWLFSLLFGIFGIDRFYLGQWKLGLGKLLTFGGCGLWSLVDLVLHLAGVSHDAWGRSLADRDRFKVLAWIVSVLVIIAFNVLSNVGDADFGDLRSASSESSQSAAAPVESSAPAKPSENAQDEVDVSAGAESPAPVADAPAGIGTPVQVDDLQLVVTGIERGQPQIEDSYIRAEAQGEFVIVSVEITNVGDAEMTALASEYELVGADGRRFAVSDEPWFVDDNLLIEGVNPGNTWSGVVIFDVPEGQELTSLEVTHGWFEDPVQVALN